MIFKTAADRPNGARRPFGPAKRTIGLEDLEPALPNLLVSLETKVGIGERLRGLPRLSALR